jgi:hypothetical protein
VSAVGAPKGAATSIGHEGERACKSWRARFFAAARSLATAMIEETQPFGRRSRLLPCAANKNRAISLAWRTTRHVLAEDRAFGDLGRKR